MKKIIEKMPRWMYHILGVSTIIISLAIAYAIMSSLIYDIVPLFHSEGLSYSILYSIMQIILIIALTYGCIKLFYFLYLRIRAYFYKRFGHIKTIVKIIHIIKWCFLVLGCTVLVTSAITIIVFLLKTNI